MLKVSSNLEDGTNMIQEVLKETGWETNYAFPVASDENVYLLSLLGEVKMKIRMLEEEAIEYREKNTKLRTHLQMVQQERAHTEALLLERQRECDTAHHQLCLAEREIGRTKQDLHELKIKRGEIRLRIGCLENEIFVKTNELNSIKQQMDYDQQLLEAYLDACEEDVKSYERLQAMQMNDESRISTLNSEAARLSEKRRAVREKLDYVVSKNDMLRLRLAAASEQCRAENLARRDVLHVWENSVKQMIKRDEDYTTLSKKYDELMDEMKQQVVKVDEVKAMVILVNDDIKAAEKAISTTNKEIWDKRCEMDKANNEVKLMEEELQTLQKTLEGTERDYRGCLAKTKQLRQSMKTMNSNLDEAKKKTGAAENLYWKVLNQRLNEEQLAKLAEEKLTSDEKCYKEAGVYHKQLTANKLKSLEELNRTSTEQKTLLSMVTGARNTIRALKKRVNAKETELIKLDELIYKAQLFNQRLEQRISKLEADPLLTQDEINMKNKQISDLQSDLEFRTKSCNTLTSMINQFTNDKRICKMRSEKLQAEMDKLKTQLDAAQLTLTNTNLALRKAESAWREMLVECNLNKHQVKRMEARLNVLRNTVLGEEMKQLQLDALEREVDVEMDARKKKVMIEMRQAETQLAEARAELTMRQRRLDQIKGRYNVTVTALAQRDEDAMDARMRYLIEALQERQNLKHRGDALDIQVRRAEEELRALENTVVVMTSLNEVARAKLLKKTQTHELEPEKETFAGKLLEAQNELAGQRKGRRKLRGNILNFEMQIDEIDAVSDLLRERFQTASACLSKAIKGTEETQARYNRADRRLNQLIGCMDRFLLANRPDVEVRVLRDFNRLIYQLYDRYLKNSPATNDELLTAEQVLFTTLGYIRPSGITSRIATDNTKRQVKESTLPASAKPSRRAQAKQKPPPEPQNLAVITIGEKINCSGMPDHHENKPSRNDHSPNARRPK